MRKIKVLSDAGIVPHGDCGACCLGTLLGISVEKAYEIYGNQTGLSYRAIINILQKSATIYENFLPSYSMLNNSQDWFPFGYPAYKNWMAWFNLSRERTNRGMVGISPINFNCRGNIDPCADHYVLITVEDRGEPAKDKIVCINCPTKGYYELSAHDFLMKCGGYNTIWVEPKVKI